MKPATSRQIWALFNLTRKLGRFEFRNRGITFEQASKAIDDLTKGSATYALSLIGAEGEFTVPVKVDWQALYDAAHKAGMDAANTVEVIPMVVQQRANPMDDSSAVVKSYFVGDGVCGFAWVNISPGNCAFANWLKKSKLADRDSYYGGVTVWVHDFNQSMTRKEAYAGAFARVVREAGIKAYCMSRMD